MSDNIQDITLKTDHFLYSGFSQLKKIDLSLALSQAAIAQHLQTVQEMIKELNTRGFLSAPNSDMLPRRIVTAKPHDDLPLPLSSKIGQLRNSFDGGVKEQKIKVL